MKLDYTRYYRTWHPDTPEHVAGMVAFNRRILAPHLPAERGAAVADVGCGGGFALLALRELGYTAVTGVDADEGQVAACRRRGLAVEWSGDTVAWLRARAAALRAIVLLDVLEHVPVGEQLEFVGALAGALGPGGSLICTVPNANAALAARWRYNDWTHRCSFTEHSLDFLLFNGGFGEIRVEAVEFLERPRNAWWPLARGARHWWAFRFFRMWRRLEMMAELGPQQGRGVPLSLNLLGVARKA